jgi:alanine dehydrogenase
MVQPARPQGSELTLAVMAVSRKENERRLPLDPRHLSRIPPELRARVFLESGYGVSFGVTDAELAEWVGGFGSHDELVARCDVVLQPKPILADIAELRPNQVFWGWPHCVQDAELTQLAIDRRLTLIAFEAMNHWNTDGSFSLHVFHKNNELAGYSSVLHALQLTGSTGHYGRRLTAAVIGFGATARGAVTALNGLGIHDVDVLTHRGTEAVASPIHSARIVQFENGAGLIDPEQTDVDTDPESLASFLAAHDVIVNCSLQNPSEPMMFLTDDDLAALVPGTLIVDVSCDAGMGFPWARPTTFTDPIFEIGDRVAYYGVDHSPSHLWASATWENSGALLPFLPVVLGGPTAWDADPTISRAIEVRDGAVQNAAILVFQGRGLGYPHGVIAS